MRSYETFTTRHAVITQRAQRRFELADYAGIRDDSRQRLLLYRQVVDRLVEKVRQILGPRSGDALTWAAMKAVYSTLASGRPDWNIAETFFNSLSRRHFTTVGVNEDIEFVVSDYEDAPVTATSLCYKSVQCKGSMTQAVTGLLESFIFNLPYGKIDGQAAEVARRIEHALGDRVDRFEVLKNVFYRGGAAYIVGRIIVEGDTTPFAVALISNKVEIYVDAVLLGEKDVSILFSFTRSYFFVDLDQPHTLIKFLSQLLPAKRVAELYISIGLNKHGKTELFREVVSHTHGSKEKFVLAPGQRGMVMRVFTMPSYDLVIKIIRDQFDYPKTSTRDEVKEKYRHVFMHSRAGRLVDAQEFEHLQFAKALFSEELLSELLRTCAMTVSVDNDVVTIRHAYVQRRVTPLDIYMKESDEDVALSTAVDFGAAIKDLASANIFPGDMLLKNFGATRHGRVVFYDYDELSSIEECVFRDMPVASSYDDEMSAQPWFAVDEQDVFPEEFVKFLGLRPDELAAFERVHSDLFSTAFWREQQVQIGAGQITRSAPYPPSRRLRIT